MGTNRDWSSLELGISHQGYAAWWQLAQACSHSVVDNLLIKHCSQISCCARCAIKKHMFALFVCQCVPAWPGMCVWAHLARIWMLSCECLCVHATCYRPIALTALVFTSERTSCGIVHVLLCTACRPPPSRFLAARSSVHLSQSALCDARAGQTMTPIHFFCHNAHLLHRPTM